MTALGVPKGSRYANTVTAFQMYVSREVVETGLGPLFERVTVGLLAWLRRLPIWKRLTHYRLREIGPRQRKPGPDSAAL